MCGPIRPGLLALIFGSAPVLGAELASPLKGPLRGVPELPVPEYLEQEKPSEELRLPRVPEEVLPQKPGGLRFRLQGLVFSGNTVFTDAELEATAASFLQQAVSLADLEEIRFRLTRKYIDAGYISSGALLPDQHIADGVVRYRIVEGRLSSIRIEGNGRLRPAYIEDRLRRDADEVLSTGVLQERFRMLLADPLIERLNGALHPGAAPGEAILDLRVTRAKPYRLTAFVDNQRPPSTGAEEVGVRGTLFDLTGFGDSFSFEADKSEGANDLYAGFTLPLTARDTRFLMFYQDDHASVIEESLQIADIKSKFRDFSLGVTHPVVNRLERRLSLGAVLALRRSRTYLLGEPTAFAAGVEDDGTARTTILRLGQEYVQRRPERVLAVRSTLNVGLDAFGATIHDDLPDSDFLTWTGQLQLAHRFAPADSQLLLRGVVQLASNTLLPQERIAIGGWETVRGYRENELVRDNGYAVSVEYRHPIVGGISEEGRRFGLQLAVFSDLGGGWNKGGEGDRDTLASVGVGVLWSHGPVGAILYLAHALTSRPDFPDHDLQDEGIQFQVTADVE